jgi:predicted amidohydrolase YtcJ
MKNIALFVGITLLMSCSVKKVDMVVHHATIYTVDSGFSVAEAMAINEGEIVAIGSNDEILRKFSAREAIDAEGKIIYPGFIDAHAHFIGYGKSLFQVNLFGCNSWTEVLQRVQQFAAAHPDEKWIRGRGWDQNKFAGKQFPLNDSLSR